MRRIIAMKPQGESMTDPLQFRDFMYLIRSGFEISVYF